MGFGGADTPQIDSPLFNVSPNATLSDLANRNARFMAHFSRAELFEAGRRLEILRRTFGNEIDFLELTFGTTEATSIQEAASFQSPETGHWFATLILVK